MARDISYIPLKISFYMAILESLFTTSEQEIIHKVSERVAFYLGGTTENKLKNFRAIKAAYNIRSRFFHGQTFAKTRKEILEISKSTDGILRLVLNKVIINDSKIFLQKGENLNDYLETSFSQKKIQKHPFKVPFVQ